MSRVIRPLMDAWEFSSGEHPAAPGTATIVELPHDWAIHRPIIPDMQWGVDQAFRDWWGIGWYRKMLHIDTVQPDTSYLLDSDGMYEQARIYVNGELVGAQNYGYTPFITDLTAALHDGDNELLIRIENCDAPTDRWYSGAGIYRTLQLIEVPHTHLDARHIVIQQNFDNTQSLTYEHADCVQLRIDTGIDDDVLKQQHLAIRITVRDAQHQVVAQGLQQAESETQCVLDIEQAHLWSADNPYLYQVQFELIRVSSEQEDSVISGAVLDTVTVPTGLRNIVFDPEHGMIVNGQETTFRGVCLHQDGGCIGSATTRSSMKARLEQLKAMGCNGLRLAHHAHPRQMLDLADEMGFYVYAEPFDKWQSGHYKRYFDQGWYADLAAMVMRDRNRPSIVIWGVGNEVENQAKRSMLEILQKLVDATHDLDSTRPVGCAMSPHFQYERADTSASEGIIQATDETLADAEIEDPAERVERIARIARITDITVLNYSEQWYERVHEVVPDKLIFGSEVYQWFVGHDLQMQDYISDNPNLVPERLPYVIGGAIWAGFDYLGESMGWPSKGWSGALIRTNGVPKAGYWLMKSYWQSQGEPFVHFMVADYTQPDENIKEHWDIPPFVHHWEFPYIHKAVVPFMVATNCDEIQIVLPTRTLYFKPVAEFDNRVVTGYLPYQPGDLVIIGLRDGEEVCREVVSTPVSPAVTLQWFDPATQCDLGDQQAAEHQYIELDAAADSRILLSVQARDTSNHAVFNENAPVRFCVDGPATIIGVDNGNLMSNEPYGHSSIHMYQGIASVMLRPTGEGRIVVRASAPGMQSTQLTLLSTRSK